MPLAQPSGKVALGRQFVQTSRSLGPDFGDALAETSAHVGAGVAECHPSGHRGAERNRGKEKRAAKVDVMGAVASKEPSR